ncbi:MAG: 23S rRNA (pseudouridine(1915)-N(3))-methyltransferase RlmH [Rhodospirillaceae bacterium]|nr:23S rRNA (pseudouridine(1915)-N(3))-methyltransferase RlmH [Rhodospirillaceae bacterium]
MRVTIAAIGKARQGAEMDLIDEYLKRLPWKVDVKEFEFKSERDPARRTARESEALLKSVSKDTTVVALDERGKAETSAAFAARLGRLRDSGRGVSFLIGGADGHDESVRGRADHLMAFGPATWPHMLVRVLLAEQLFRAHTILSGHPYHRK